MPIGSELDQSRLHPIDAVRKNRVDGLVLQLAKRRGHRLRRPGNSITERAHRFACAIGPRDSFRENQNVLGCLAAFRHCNHLHVVNLDHSLCEIPNHHDCDERLTLYAAVWGECKCNDGQLDIVGIRLGYNFRHLGAIPAGVTRHSHVRTLAEPSLELKVGLTTGRLAMLHSDSIRYFKRKLRALAGQDHLLTPDVIVERKKIGSDYGGWVIAPAALPTVAQPIVLSFGLGDDITFDLELIERYNVEVYGFDPTEASLAWLRARSLPQSMHVYPIGLAHFDGKQRVTLPDADKRGNFSAKAQYGRSTEVAVMRYQSLVSMLHLSQVDIVKLDIEGSEYDVVPDLLAADTLPTQLLIEFHHRLYDMHVSDTLRVVRLLRGRGYALFDVSPGGRELSFILGRRLDALQ